VKRMSIVTGATIALTVLALPAQAQLNGAIDFGGGLGQQVQSSWLPQLGLSPTLRFDHPHASLQTDASVLDRAGLISLAHTAAEANLRSSLVGPVAASLTSRLSSDALPATTSTSFDGALSVRRGAGGAWLGAAAARTTSRVDAPARASTFSAGAWRSLGSLTVTFAAKQQQLDLTPMTRSYPDSSRDSTGKLTFFRHSISGGRDSSASLQRWTDFETNLRWASGPLEINGRVTIPTRTDSIRRSTSGELGLAMQLG
jgi:hypothetical protein